MVYRLNETTWLQDVGGGTEIFYFLNWAMLTIVFSSEDQIFYNIFTTIIVIINLVILYFALIESKIKSFFLMIILGGSLGNLFDRVYYRAVPDFIDLNYAGYHWFIFNVADIFITIGIICLILSEFIFYKKKDEKN